MKVTHRSLLIAALFAVPVVGCSQATSPAVLQAGAGDAVVPAKYAGLKNLYVAWQNWPSCNSGYTNILLLKNKTYKRYYAISQGVDCTVGVTLDSQGNLYAANGGGSGNGCPALVQEYAPRASAPTFSYAGGNCLDSSVGYLSVATDVHGNVFAGTVERPSQKGSGPSVIEWSQDGSVPKIAVSLGHASYGAVYGIAVDEQSDIFVDWNASAPALGECVPSGSSCSLSVLGFKPGGAGGIALDNSANLLVADPAKHVVDVLAPPYSSVTRTIGSGFSFPLNVSLNKANTLAFVADPTAGKVFVVNYQSGANVTAIPIYDASSAVDGPNAVY